MVGNMEMKYPVWSITLKSKCSVQGIIIPYSGYFKYPEHKRPSVILYLMGTSKWYGGGCTF